MAHFAKLNDQNKVVQVVVVHNDVATDEATGVAFKKPLWSRQYGNKHHIIQEEFIYWVGHLLEKFAGIDMNYDESRDAFVPDQPFPSWTLNEDLFMGSSCTLQGSRGFTPIDFWDEDAYQADTNDPKTAGWTDSE